VIGSGVASDVRAGDLDRQAGERDLFAQGERALFPPKQAVKEPRQVPPPTL
jgi:hypothetical protein